LQPSTTEGAEQGGRFDIVLGRTYLSRRP